METICSSEVLVPSYQTTRCYNTEDHIIRIHGCENFKSCDTRNWPTYVYFFYLVGWDLTPLGPFAGPLGSYKSQYCGHILAYCTFFPG
jgi:hypothetical protein